MIELAAIWVAVIVLFLGGSRLYLWWVEGAKGFNRFARQGTAWLGVARLGVARRGAARTGLARRGQTRRGEAGLGKARLGGAGQGSARLGLAWLSEGSQKRGEVGCQSASPLTTHRKEV